MKWTASVLFSLATLEHTIWKWGGFAAGMEQRHTRVCLWGFGSTFLYRESSLPWLIWGVSGKPLNSKPPSKKPTPLQVMAAMLNGTDCSEAKTEDSIPFVQLPKLSSWQWEGQYQRVAAVVIPDDRGGKTQKAIMANGLVKGEVHSFYMYAYHK